MLDLFRLVGGIDIQNDALTSNAYILQGSGAPGGDAATQDAAPIGSLFLRTDVTGNQLQQYYKFANTNSTSDWTAVADVNYVANAVNGISWREPVIVRDGTSTTLPTGTAGNPVTVDGVSITNGQRVLFNSLTTDPNVYIYNQAAGTFTQDTNLATAGDALFVINGTSIGNRWTFTNAGQWVLFGAETDVSEIVFIDTYLGKSLGSVTPAYTSEFVITDGNSITSAISSIDTAFGAGTITNTNLQYALSSSLALSGVNGAGGTLTLTAALNALNDAIGSRDYTTGTNYFLTDGETVSTSLNALNVAIHDVVVANLEVAGSITSTPATLTTVDTIPLTLATEVTWMVQVRETATAGNRRASEVHAITDGTTVDFTRFAELKLGAGVAGYGISVIVSGSDIALQLKADNNYDYVVKRVAISSF